MGRRRFNLVVCETPDRERGYIIIVSGPSPHVVMQDLTLFSVPFATPLLFSVTFDVFVNAAEILHGEAFMA